MEKAASRLSVTVPSTAGNGQKSPIKSPHVFAEVKTFYDVGWIYCIVTAVLVFFLSIFIFPLLGLALCDTVRAQAAAALGVYCFISWTSHQPPLPFHIWRSYCTPIYLAFLYLYQHPAGGDFDAGFENLREALSSPPLHMGFSSPDTRASVLCFLGFVFVVGFAAFRFLGFLLFKSHHLAPGEKPRVLLASDGAYPSIHGVATFNTYITKRLVADGYPIHIVTGSPAFEEKDVHKIAGAPCTRVPCIFTNVGPQTPLGIPNPFQISSIFMAFRPHVVHILEPGSAMNMFLTCFCWLFCIPNMISHHTHTMEYRHSMSTTNATFSKYALFMHYRTIVSLTDLHAVTNKMLMDSRVPGVVSWAWPHVKVPNGIEPKFWVTGSNEKFDISHNNADMRFELSNGNPDAHLVVHVGRFVHEKSIMDYVPIILKLSKKYGDNIQFALVGWGPLLEPFLKAVKDAGHEQRVKAMNTLTGERLYQAYASSDIFFSPSGSEAFPIVYLEALRSGLVVISPSGPDAGGSQHTFEPEVHGYQYPRGDTAAAVEAVEKAIRAKKTLQAACLEHGRKHTWERTMDECLGFYDTVLRARDVIKD